MNELVKLPSVTAQPCIEQLWYSRVEPLNNSVNRQMGKHGQKYWPEPVPLLVLKSTKETYLINLRPQEQKIECKCFARSTVTPVSSGGINLSITSPMLHSFLQIIEHLYSINNFLGTRLMGDKYSYRYCRAQKRCPCSFIQCINNYCHLKTKCPLHQPRKNSLGFKKRLMDVYFHVLMSLEITFDSDYLFCVLNYTVYQE